ncbi:hypothetical protein DTO164E3_7548 [Paecilomyces variotii]|nr:hypothetical protein DTO164E3_7548 [Paecilomyces variotii]KAJ9353587.1 hypothetical protein DTO027B9_5289 [Paecilomyces variotii]
MFRGPGQNCREAPPRDWTRTGGGARKKWGGKKLQAGGPRESEEERRGTLATGRRGKVDEQPGRACLFRSLEQAQREGGILGDVDGFGRWILDAGLGRPGETLAGRRAAAADAASEPPVRRAATTAGSALDHQLTRSSRLKDCGCGELDSRGLRLSTLVALRRVWYIVAGPSGLSRRQRHFPSGLRFPPSLRHASCSQAAHPQLNRTPSQRLSSTPFSPSPISRGTRVILSILASLFVADFSYPSLRSIDLSGCL